MSETEPILPPMTEEESLLRDRLNQLEVDHYKLRLEHDNLKIWHDITVQTAEELIGMVAKIREALGDTAAPEHPKVIAFRNRMEQSLGKLDE
jgi:uncharacterized ferritin-like protein (DUF455 family)